MPSHNTSLLSWRVGCPLFPCFWRKSPTLTHCVAAPSGGRRHWVLERLHPARRPLPELLLRGGRHQVPGQLPKPGSGDSLTRANVSVVFAYAYFFHYFMDLISPSLYFCARFIPISFSCDRFCLITRTSRVTSRCSRATKSSMKSGWPTRKVSATWKLSTSAPTWGLLLFFIKIPFHFICVFILDCGVGERVACVLYERHFESDLTASLLLTKRFLNLYGIRGFDVPDYTQKPKPKKPEVLLKKVLRKVSRGKCRVTIWALVHKSNARRKHSTYRARSSFRFANSLSLREIAGR